MKKNLLLRIEEIAGNEIKEAYLWYEEQTPGLGDKFIAALDEAFKIIQNRQMDLNNLTITDSIL